MEQLKTTLNSLNIINPTGYEIIEKIGEGGFGTVYKAIKKSTNQFVAIKTIKFKESITLQKKQQYLARFERETEICAEINHPHIVRLLDKGYYKNKDPYAVYEFVSGKNLKDHILENKGLSANETGELMGQILDALACAHKKGIVHRDLKPNNIMITKTGAKPFIKVLDFGIGAFTQDVRSVDYKNLTITQEVLGTPTYCAPEQLRGEPPTVKSDLYAWGLILIECLTGEPVMQGNSVAEVFQQQLSSHNVPLPPAIFGHPLADFLRRILHKNTKQRVGNTETIYNDYTKINFNTLVGKIQKNISSKKDENLSLTIANNLDIYKEKGERKQITVLCARLSILEGNNNVIDIETLNTIQKDQINLCLDTATRYGGYIAGTLGDIILIYYGFPQVNDTDARCAGRTALDLIGEIKNRSTLLGFHHDIHLNIQIAINSGIIVSHKNHTPEGVTPNGALDLLYHTTPGNIIVSELTKKLLDPYLEFEIISKNLNFNSNIKGNNFRLIGERQTEALSFLRPWSADRKMVGREVEFKQIVDLWNKTTTEKGFSIIIKGQAGIGKSKLIYETKKEIRAKGFTVRECRCLPEHQNNALYTFIEMLKRHLGLYEQMEPEFITKKLELTLKKSNLLLEECVPVLCSWLNLPLSKKYQVVSSTPDKQKQILFETLKNLILQLHNGNKYVLVIEDIHWIDPTSLDFLNELVTLQQNGSILILMTTRPDFNDLKGDKRTTTITLNPLTSSFTNELISGVLDQKKIEEKAIEYVTERTDGIPLFIEELTTMLKEKNYIFLENDEYRLVDEIEEKAIPVTLSDLLNARLDRLGFAKETAQIAATIGREFSYDLLVKSSIRDEGMIQNDLELLVEADIIYLQRKVQGESYIFKHALIRDAAYKGMVNKQRIETHKKVYQSLEIESKIKIDTNPFEIAFHSFRAGYIEKSITYGILAIQKQSQRSSFDESLRIFTIIKDWVKEIKDDYTQKTNELILNDCILAIIALKKGWGDYEIEEISLRNRVLIKDLTTHKNYIESEDINHLDIKTNWSLFTFLHAQSRNKESKLIGNEILEKAILIKNHKVEMAISAFLGQSYFVSGEIEKSKMLFLNVFNKFNTFEDKEISLEYGFDPYVFAAGMLGYIFGFSENPETAYDYYLKGIEYSKQTNNDTTILSASVFLISFLSIIDKKELCATHIKDMHEFLGDKISKVWVSEMFYIVEDWTKDQFEIAESKRNAMIACGQSLVLSFYEPSLIKTYLAKGKYDKAIEIIEDSIKRQIQHEEKSTLPIFYHLLALSLYLKFQKITPEVENLFQKAIDLSTELNFDLLKIRAKSEYSNILKNESQFDNTNCYESTLVELESNLKKMNIINLNKI
ncbi:MAG: TOMM system kinase/cyclase fusion protein [Limnohabitans sp.]|nr:TOMM system kinase/cyclase fusion protein [Limnohabitans sp.]